MFGKLKEKLKSWFKKTEKEAEKAEIIEEKPKVKEEEAKKKKKVEKPEVKEKPTALLKEEKEEKSFEPAEIPEKPFEEVEIPEEAGKEEKKSIFRRIKEKFIFRVSEEYFEEIFSGLELLLLENNVALEVVEKIKSDLKQELVGVRIKKPQVQEEVKKALRISLESLFVEELDLLEKIKARQKEKLEEPFVIVFFGINGSGKTTTIAKISHLLQKNNISCVLAASDTFRAASIEQLQKHADKLKIKLIKQDYGADPAAVAFDAIKHAKAHNINVVLIDTAGRMHTKSNLMKEMEKICRVSKPDLKIFVAESITGNDAIEQAKKFNESVGIDAIILTKADVDDKGGAMISVSFITGKPIIYLGIGQNYGDLEKFDSKKLIDSLIS